MSRLSRALIAHYKMNENTANDNDEVITNGDFESGFIGGLGNGWTLPRGNASDETIDFHGGAHAQELTNPAGDAGIITQQKALVSGRTYRLSFWAKKSKGTGGSVVDAFPGSYFGPITIDEATFTEHVIFFVAVAGCDILVGFCANTNASDDTNGILFDDVSIKLCAVEDSSGNDHDGLAQQDTDAISVTGKINTAFDFNGSSDYIEIGTSPFYAESAIKMSVSLWAYVDISTFDTDMKMLLNSSAGSPNTNKGFYIGVDDRGGSSSPLNGVQFSVGTVSGYEAVKTNDNVFSSVRWYHIVATYGNNAGKIYINGVDVGNRIYNGSGNFVPRNYKLYIGASNNDSAFYNGLFDNVAFFNVELTPDEIKCLYNNGRGTEIPSEWDIPCRTRSRIRR